MEYDSEIIYIKKKRDMHLINIKVSPDRFEHLPDYIKSYCNKKVYTYKDTPKINGCGANHGTCTICGKGNPMQKKIHKMRVESKKYYIDY